MELYNPGDNYIGPLYVTQELLMLLKHDINGQCAGGSGVCRNVFYVSNNSDYVPTTSEPFDLTV